MTTIPPINALPSADLTPPLPSSRAAHPAGTGAAHPEFAEAIRAAASSAMRAQRDTSVGQEFEAVALTSFVQHLLPSEDSIVWGGQAGRLWRGVFAQHLASEVAAAGGIGIADIINTTLAERTGDGS
ncbi:rod-binding protein [Acuticoccus sediminis]|uniref:rod-binding protein n=1 Tax=Acuticoccus sediminis TaxID=2184697 RepID=UPI001CFCF615|nr:rod-binding protein [Acuticoccus sediminis]